MRVLILATGFPPAVGGLERYAVNLARGLQAAGCSVQVVTTLGGGGAEPVRDVPVVRTPPQLNRKFLKLLPLAVAAFWQCVRQRPDRVVAMTWTHEGVTARLLRAVFGIEYLIVACGSEVLQCRRRAAFRVVMRGVLRRASQIVAISEYTRSLVACFGVPRDRITVLHPPIEAVAAGAPYADADARFGLAGRRVLLTVSRLVPRKGHAQVIEVLARLEDRYPDLVYVVTGTGPYLGELQRLAAAAGVGDRLLPVGTLSDEELRGLYLRADLYVSPSTEVDGDVEGFGLALAEAGAHGLAVVAGRSGGVADVIQDGETGILVTPGDLDDLEHAIASLLGDATRRRVLGRQAQVRVTEGLRIDRQGARLRGLLSAPAAVSLGMRA